MAELARCDCPAGRRMAELLASVIQPDEPAKKRPRTGRKRSSRLTVVSVAHSRRGISEASGLDRRRVQYPAVRGVESRLCRPVEGNDRAGTRTQDQRAESPPA